MDVHFQTRGKDFCCGTQEQIGDEYDKEMFTVQKTTTVW